MTPEGFWLRLNRVRGAGDQAADGAELEMLFWVVGALKEDELISMRSATEHETFKVMDLEAAKIGEIQARFK